MARSKSDIFHLLQTDRELSVDVRRHLVASLFASPASLVLGAAAGGAAGLSAASISNNPLTMAVGIAVPIAGLARVIQAALMNRAGFGRVMPAHAELQYELGAWIFSALLGVLAFLSLTRTSDSGLHLLCACVTIGYAAGICTRNAGRPTVALGQLILATGPLTIALALSGDPTRWVLAMVTILFMLGMSDITRRTYLAFLAAVSESRARENAVREQLDLLPNMIWSADAAGHITFRSARWKEFTGLDFDGWDAMSLLVHEADLPTTGQSWLSAVKAGTPFEAAFRLRHHSGSFRWVLSRGRPRRDETGRVVGWLGACADIQDHRITPL